MTAIGCRPSNPGGLEGKFSGESMSSEMRAIRSRLDFSKIPTSIQIPNLIEVQRRSYERFLQMDKLPQEREDNGLQSVFTSVFPITDFRNVVELEYDQKNTLYVRIDRKRKFLGTIFLRALGLRTDEEILKTFYTVDTINVKDGKLSWKVVPEGQLTNLQGTRPAAAITVKGEEIAPATRKISAHTMKGLRSHKIEAVEVETSEFDGAMTAGDVVDLTTGELLYEANQELTADKLHKIVQSGVTSFEVFFPERDDVGNIITNTLRRDSVRKPEEALIEIYRKLRPGDPPTLDTATALFEGMFFDPRKYDFSRVGRLKF